MVKAARALALALCGGAAALRLGAQEDLDYPLRGVVAGHVSEDLVQGFAKIQKTLVQDLYATWPKGTRPLRILIATSVGDTQEELDRYEANMNKLISTNPVNDTFSLAIVHTGSNDTLFKSRPWYTPNIVLQSGKAPLCKGEAWALLDPKIVKAHDFVWLLDNDFSFDYFNWHAYRMVLSTLRPLVSQPAISRGHPADPEITPEDVKMVSRGSNGYFPLAYESAETDGEATLISTVLWDSMRARLVQPNALKSSYCTHEIWDSAAIFTNSACAMTAPLVINVSPLRRMRFDSLPVASGDGPWFTCMGKPDEECPRIEKEEVAGIKKATKPFCSLEDSVALIRQVGDGGVVAPHTVGEAQMWGSKDEGVIEKIPKFDPYQKKLFR